MNKNKYIDYLLQRSVELETNLKTKNRVLEFRNCVKRFEDCLTKKEKQKKIGITTVNEKFKTIYFNIGSALHSIKERDDMRTKAMEIKLQRIINKEPTRVIDETSTLNYFHDDVMKLKNLGVKDKAFLLLLAEFFDEHKISVAFLIERDLISIIRVFMKNLKDEKLTKLQKEVFEYTKEISKLKYNKENNRWVDI